MRSLHHSDISKGSEDSAKVDYQGETSNVVLLSKEHPIYLPMCINDKTSYPSGALQSKSVGDSKSRQCGEVGADIKPAMGPEATCGCRDFLQGANAPCSMTVPEGWCWERKSAIKGCERRMFLPNAARPCSGSTAVPS